jgi:hypothetical protein
MNPIRSFLPIAAVAVVLSCVAAGEPRIVDQQELKAYDFGKLTEAQAKALDGKRIKVRLRITLTTPIAHSGLMMNDCSGDGNEQRKAVFLAKNQPSADQVKHELFVEGLFELHPSTRINGVERPAYLVLNDAKILKP